MAPLVVANWKMHFGVEESTVFIKKFFSLQGKTSAELVIAPSFTALSAVGDMLKGSSIKLGAQDLYWEQDGAFTGAISPLQLRERGVSYVIVGHSERRQFFGETDIHVNKKVHAALSNHITPIVCVGETKLARSKGKGKTVVAKQIRAALKGIPDHKMVIAYEPLWSIGGGKADSPEDVADMLTIIRKEVGTGARILYGGSVDPKNAKRFAQHPEIQGFLVGSHSLVPATFSAIVSAFHP